MIPHAAEAYIATVDDWYWDYTFGLEHFRRARRNVVLHEDASITVLGTLKIPKALLDWRIALHFWPIAEMNGQNETVTTKSCVGWLDSYKKDKLMVASIEFPRTSCRTS